MKFFIRFGVTSAVLLGAATAARAQVSLEVLGRYETGIFDDSAVEVAAYDAGSQRLYVTSSAENATQVLDIADPSAPSLAFSIELENNINSVAVHAGLVAAAVEGETAQGLGQAIFFNIDGDRLNAVTVGALPDMLTFTPDGRTVVVANEGEPSEDYENDPEGSVSIIDLSDGVASATVITAGLSPFNRNLAENVRVFGPEATFAQDAEPEYIAVSPDSRTAWVAFQENNALGSLDLTAGEFVGVVGLGFKDYSQPGNRLDASNRDEAVNLANYDNLFGMYQPDAIAADSVGGETCIISVNEGDARLRPSGDDEIDGLEAGDRFNEEDRIGDLDLDPVAFPNAAELQDDAVLGRLKVTNTLGDTDGDGDFDALYAYGARSSSIWDAAGNLVFDSGDQFARFTAVAYPADFNSTKDENGSFGDRSDDKGSEPEGVAVGEIGDRTFAFIGLERMGGIAIYDVTDPTAPAYHSYTNSRDFAGDAEAGTAGDLGDECGQRDCHDLRDSALAHCAGLTHALSML